MEYIKDNITPPTVAQLRATIQRTPTLFSITKGKSGCPILLQKYDTVTFNQKGINQLEHDNGHIRKIIFKDGTEETITAMFVRVELTQADILTELGCTLNEYGFAQIDMMHHTSVAGIYAAGDNSLYGMRAISVAVAEGNKAGDFINHELIEEDF